MGVTVSLCEEQMWWTSVVCWFPWGEQAHQKEPHPPPLIEECFETLEEPQFISKLYTLRVLANSSRWTVHSQDNISDDVWALRVHSHAVWIDNVCMWAHCLSFQGPVSQSFLCGRIFPFLQKNLLLTRKIGRNLGVWRKNRSNFSNILSYLLIFLLSISGLWGKSYLALRNTPSWDKGQFRIYLRDRRKYYFEKQGPGMTWRELLNFLDDINVLDTSFENHLKNLWMTSECWRSFNLMLKPRKCQGSVCSSRKKLLFLGL